MTSVLSHEAREELYIMFDIIVTRCLFSNNALSKINNLFSIRDTQKRKAKTPSTTAHDMVTNVAPVSSSSSGISAGG